MFYAVVVADYDPLHEFVSKMNVYVDVWQRRSNRWPPQQEG